jgi:hypothetical protein
MTSSAAKLIPVKNDPRPAQTRYLKSVKPPSTNMLKRGSNNKKLGDKVTVKMWKGMTMYSLSLEERATCPPSCKQWENCYGDNMPFAHRFDHTHPKFIEYLEAQLQTLNEKHKEGFVVRLHVLGDFYSDHYIVQWQKWLNQFENLHVFGYTHIQCETPWGQLISHTNSYYRERFRIRFSDDSWTAYSAHVFKQPMTIHINIDEKSSTSIVCPEQLAQTDSCATCGYCWASEKPVVFIEH